MKIPPLSRKVFSRFAAVCLITSTALIFPQHAFAASGTWNGTTDGAWNSTTNWTVNPAPGSTAVTSNTDAATFDNSGNGKTTLTIDLNRNLRTFNFGTSTVSYTIGSAGANGGNALRLSSSGAISLLATATGTNLTQTFNAPLTLYGGATFTNASIDTGSALVFAGNITNAATSTLTLSGAGRGTGNLISGNLTDGVGVQSLTINATAGKWTLSGTNNYSGLTNITGAGSTTVMQGSNSSSGATTLNHASATLQLNSASNGGLASGLFSLTAGRLEALTATRSLSNAITLGGGPVLISGDQSINFNGKLTSAAFRTLTNNLTAGKVLTLSNVDINSDGSNNRVLTIAGTGDTNITGTVANGTTTGHSLAINSTGTTTLTGNSTYNGGTTVNGGTTILDATAGPASLNTASALNFGGGTFIFKGDAAGSDQTLAGVGVGLLSGSTLKVVGGAGGTSLDVGAVSIFGSGDTFVLNINLDSTAGSAAFTTTTLVSELPFTRGRMTVTTGGTTEFATKSASNVVQLTGQTGFVGSGSSNTIDYQLSGTGQVTVTEAMQTLRINTSGTGQSLDLNGKILTVPGLLFVGTHAYEIKDVATGGSLKGAGSNSEMNLHNFGTQTLTISAAISNGGGNSTLSIDGGGTTVLSGINTYLGATHLGGGAIVSIGAYSALGNGTTNSAASILTLNNATLRTTGTFTMNNGTHDRLITLGANGGTFDVTGANILTAPGFISSVGSLTKTGTGTLALSSINTYSGGTTVSAGMLLANTAVSGANSATGTGAVAVNGGALGGTGQITPTGFNGITVASGASIAPGASIGTLTINLTNTIGGVTMDNGSTFSFELGAAGLSLDAPGTSDLLVLSGASIGDFTFAALGNTVNLSGGSNGFYKLFDTSLENASLAGDSWNNLTYDLTSGLVSSGLISGGNSFFVGTGIGLNGGDLGDIYVQIIPEPSTFAMILLSMVGLLVTTRRRFC